MNYGEHCKNEILDCVEEEASLRFPFLCAVTKAAAGIDLFRSAFRLVYEFKSDRTALVTAALLKERYGCETEISFRTAARETVSVAVPADVSNTILRETGLSYGDRTGIEYRDGSGVPASMNSRLSACGYMQGIFCVCGSVWFPDDIYAQAGYHLEMDFDERNLADAVRELARRCGLTLSVAERGERYVLYSKNSAVISDFLAFLRAPDSVMALNDVLIRREISNNTNRQANVSAYNYDKTLASNSKYIAAIEYLDKHGGLDRLDEKSAAVARARRAFPDDSMSVLAGRLAISKSALARSLAKIAALAREAGAQGKETERI